MISCTTGIAPMVMETVPTTAPELYIRRITHEDELMALRDEWNRLLEHSRVATFQLTWEWMYAWWKTFSSETHQLVVLACYSDQHLVGLAPFVMRLERIIGPLTLRRLEFMGTGEAEADEVATEYPDIIADSNFEQQVIEAVWRHVQDINPKWGEITFVSLLPDSNVMRYLLPLVDRAKIWRTQDECGHRFFIPLPPDWTTYLERLGSKMQRLLYIQRRLQRSGDIKHYRVSDDDLPAAFDELRRLHALRWSTKDCPGVFASERFDRFHRHLIQLLHGREICELRFIQKDGENIACVYNFCYGDTVYYYQSGLDATAAPNISLGMIMHVDAIHAAINGNFKCFDMMRGKLGSYKQDYKCTTVPMYNVTLYNKSFKGRIFYLSHRMLGALRKTARRLERLHSSWARAALPDGLAALHRNKRKLPMS